MKKNKLILYLDKGYWLSVNKKKPYEISIIDIDATLKRKMSIEIIYIDE